MGNLSDKLEKIPKPVLIVVMLVFVGVMGWAVVTVVFGGKEKFEQETEDNMFAGFPDGETAKLETDRLKQLDLVSEGNANDYWNSLSDDGMSSKVSSGDFIVGGDSDAGKVFLDPSVYSELEIEQIRRGIKTKEQIDVEHAELEAIRQQSVRSTRSAEEQERYRDSIIDARLNRTMEMMSKYAGQSDAATSQSQKKPAESESPKEPEPRHIEIGKTESGISSVRLVEDGIICSLDDPVVEDVDSHVKDVLPVKVTFLESEVVVSGQRVIMRLLQDLYLSNGTVIPANTHVTGICKIGGRLGISISTISYDGRIYYAHLDAYDNDGTEGIYCPVIAADKAKKAGKSVAKKTGQTLSELASSAVSLVNPYAGVISRSGLSEMMSIVTDEGVVAVNVAAGYEFYLYEDMEANSRKKDSGESSGDDL